MQQFADDFGGYGTTTAFMLNGLYAQVDNSILTDDPDPNITGTVWSTGVSPINGTRLRRVLNTAFTEGGFAFRLWMNQLPSNANATLNFGFSNNANTWQVYWHVDSTGRIIVSNGVGDISESVSPALVANAWNHVECKFLASDTVGELEIRVNGVVLNMTADSGLDTNTQYSQFRIDNPNSTNGPSFYVKDLIVWDTTGAQNNDFYGTVNVIGRTTTSDVSFNWAPSTGTTGYNLIDNSPPLDVTQYISAGNPPPAASVFGLSPLPVDVTSVRCMTIQMRAAKVDGGDGNIQAGMISDGDTDLGAERPITTAFTYYEDQFPLDPATNAPWTPAAANAATPQINRTV